MVDLEFNSLAETKQWAHEFVRGLARPSVLLLNGPMGAGKTEFVRCWVAELGGDAVSSPTFAIHQRYSTRAGPVDHFDLYRLESAAEVESSGLWDILQDDQVLAFVEWAERVPRDWWPRDKTLYEITIDPLDGERRRVRLQRINK